MEQKDFTDAVLNYVIHIADNQSKMVEYQTRMVEALATISKQAEATAAILERVVQTTDRTEQMVARILAGAAPDKVSH
jgi:hypothetical protein